jgi:O-acetyl-ADP-ribose deacetylase (regulator of RNase III)
MFPERVFLLDRERRLAAAWKEAFSDVAAVEVVHGDFFSTEAEAMVSPANSFGIMDGGLDRAIRDVLGAGVERRVRDRIIEHHHGELPVGLAEVVATDDARWPLLVCAPTMRIPESASNTTNAYLAFRAALLALVRHGTARGRPVASVVCPGLCTGIGAMSARRCAAQMRIAFRQVSNSPATPSFAEIHRTHQAMRSE